RRPAEPTPGARSPWAPDGPAPQSRAAHLAALVQGERASGALAELPDPRRGALTATELPPAARAADAAPVPVRGMPPRVAARCGAIEGAVRPKARFRPAETRPLAGAQPRWEAGPAAALLGERAEPCCPGCGAAQGTSSARSCGCGGNRG